MLGCCFIKNKILLLHLSGKVPGNNVMIIIIMIIISNTIINYHYYHHHHQQYPILLDSIGPVSGLSHHQPSPAEDSPKGTVVVIGVSKAIA